MTDDDLTQQHSTLMHYVQVARRRKWIILQALILVPLAAVAFSLRQEKLYRSSAEVLLSRQNLAASLQGATDPNLYQQADRIAATQAEVARVPEVAAKTLEAAGVVGRTPRGLLGSSSVVAKQGADLLEFSVTDHDPAVARTLATTYAHEFTLYRRELDTASLERAREQVSSELRRLEGRKRQGSSLYDTLLQREQQLRTMEALQTANAFVVHEADTALQVQPRPLRNGVLGLLLGLVLGLGLAFLWEALDTRLRTAGEIGQRLGMPLLARLPDIPRRLRGRDKLVMLEDPHGPQAEAFRMLRTNLDFARLDREAKMIMVTSAVEREGKSTTSANLAVALARAGQRVILVDLDLRRPYLDRFFGLQGQPGLTQVVLGHVSLDGAIAPVALSEPEGRGGRSGPLNGNGNGNGNGRGKMHGLLEVLPAGPIPPDAGEFVGTRALSALLAELRERADVVIVDTPPVLRVGDAMTLSARIDSIIVVTRLKLVRRPMMAELRRLLESSPAERLGFVVTGADEEAGYGQGYGYGYYYRSGDGPIEERESVAVE